MTTKTRKPSKAAIKKATIEFAESHYDDQPLRNDHAAKVNRKMPTRRKMAWIKDFRDG